MLFIVVKKFFLTSCLYLPKLISFSLRKSTLIKEQIRILLRTLLLSWKRSLFNNNNNTVIVGNPLFSVQVVFQPINQ